MPLTTVRGLNPCSIGICSLSTVKNVVVKNLTVLILVLLEYAL